MKNLLLLLFSFTSFILSVSAQDTIKVQTFTWEDNHRADTFDFPDNPNQTYRKILMKYNMRCHDAIVGNGSNGCLEWDYSCNTFITDPSRIDSSKATAPDYTISNFTGTSFIYSNDPTYSYLSFTHHETELEPINPLEVDFEAQGPIVPYTPAAVTYRYQVILTSEELSAAVLNVGGALHGIRMTLLQPGSIVGFLKIRIKNTDQSNVGERPDETGLTEVYFKSTDLSGSEIEFPFYQIVSWEGQHFLLDISFTTSSASDAPAFKFFESSTDDRALVSSQQTETNLYFGGASNLDVPAATFENIQDEITLSFWAFGDPFLLPANTHFVDGKDAAGQRHATIHLPWSNGEVYWDCGNDGNGFDRINKPVDPADYEGKWSHWAFTKNAITGEMKIFLNGQLFHSGTGKTKKMNFNALRFGQSLTNSETYFGSIDEIQIWDKALDENTIQTWMLKQIDDTHPEYTHLRGYYQLNEGQGNKAVDASSYHIDAPLTLPLWRQVRGDKLFHHFSKTNLIPEFTFFQFTYIIHDSAYTVLDSILSPLHQVIHFGVEGTDLVRLDTQYVYPAGNRPVYDENGTLIDTILAAADGTIIIQTLNYYAKSNARYELLSLVTPYGIGLDLGQKGKTFTFDVTDFAPILKGRKRLSVEFGGENQE
ncbi:MAG TPA: LamG domain-containing protein, partial [Saprospiraceae bacterium]